MTPVQLVVQRRVTERDLERDVQLLRIQFALIHMRRNAWAPIEYHGKMRVEDVRELEAIRLQHAPPSEAVQGIRLGP